MQIGRYTIEGELGRGGMGVVYRVRDPSGRELALKLLTKARSDGAERFAREARLQEQLGEEVGFVPLFDLGSSPAGAYLVMPLLSGGTLRDRLERGALGTAESVTLLTTLAEALGHAHAQGVVHRDLKPDNVLFSAGGRALVADLGLAKHFRRDLSGGSQSQALSLGGELRGTLGYMAPEQLKDASAVGPAADVFALGAVLYECLTGVPCFEGSSYVELLSRVARGGHGALPRGCPRWLKALLGRCLHPDPARRPADGAQLAAALRAGGGRSALLRGALALALGVWALAAGVFFMSTRDGAASAPGVSPSPSVSLSPTPLSTYPPAWGDFLAAEGIALTRAAEYGAPVQALTVDEAGRVLVFAGGRFCSLEGEGLSREGEGPAAGGSLEVTVRPEAKSPRGASFALEVGVAVSFGDAIEVFDLRSGRRLGQVAAPPPERVALDLRGLGALSARGLELTHYPVLRAGRPGTLLATLEDPIGALAAGPHGYVVASGATATLLDPQTRARGRMACGGPIAAAAATEEGVFLATESGALYRFDSEGNPRGDPVPTDLERLVGLSVGGGLAALIDGKQARVIELASGEVLARLDLRGLGAKLTQVALGPAGQTLALGSDAGHALRFELRLSPPPALPLAPLRVWGDERGRHAGIVTAVGVASGRLVSGDVGGFVHEWDPVSGRSLGSARPGSTLFALSPVGAREVLAIAADGVSLWDLPTGRERWRIPCQDLPRAATLRPDGLEVVLAVGGELESWSLPERRKAQRVVYPDGPTSVALLPDGRLLVGDQIGKVRLLAVGWQASVWVTPADEDGIEVLALNEAGDEVLAVGHSGRVRVLEVATGATRRDFQARGPVNSASRRGGRILLGLQRGELELWNEVSGAQVIALRSPLGAQVAAALLDEQRAFVGGTRGRVSVIELAPAAEGADEGLPVAREVWEQSEGHEGGVRALAFSLKGDQLSALGNRRLRSWSVPDGQPGLFMTAGVVTRGSLGADFALLSALDDYPPEGSRSSGTLGFYGVIGGLRRSGPVRLAGTEPDAQDVSWKGQVFAFTRRGERNQIFLGRGFAGDDLGAIPARGVDELRLSEDGYLLAVSTGRQVEVWRLGGEAAPKQLWAQDRRVGRMRWLPYRGGWKPPLALTDQLERVVTVLDGLTGGAIAEVTPRQSASIVLLGGIADPALLLTGLKDGRLDLWRLSDGAHVRRLALADPTDLPISVAVSPKGDYLAVGTARSRIALFKLERKDR